MAKKKRFYCVLYWFLFNSVSSNSHFIEWFWTQFHYKREQSDLGLRVDPRIFLIGTIEKKKEQIIWEDLPKPIRYQIAGLPQKAKKIYFALP